MVFWLLFKLYIAKKKLLLIIFYFSYNGTSDIRGHKNLIEDNISVSEVTMLTIYNLNLFLIPSTYPFYNYMLNNQNTEIYLESTVTSKYAFKEKFHVDHDI